MKKQGLAIALSTALMASVLGGCDSSNNDKKVSVNSKDAVEVTSMPEKPGVTEEVEDQGIDVDENLLTVDITLPASLFEDTTEEEIKKSAKENNFISYNINKDGSVTYKMTKLQRKKMLKQYRKSIDEACKSMVQGGDNAVESFTDISHNSDMTHFEILVDGAKYTEWDSLSIIAFYISGAYYQIFAGVEPDDVDIEVEFVDKDTKEVKNKGSYQEWIKSADE